MREETIASWMRRLDEEGEAGLVQLEEPVNKFPDYVAYMVRSSYPQIGSWCKPGPGKALTAPTMGP